VNVDDIESLSNKLQTLKEEANEILQQMDPRIKAIIEKKEEMLKNAPDPRLPEVLNNISTMMEVNEEDAFQTFDVVQKKTF